MIKKQAATIVKVYYVFVWNWFVKSSIKLDWCNQKKLFSLKVSLETSTRWSDVSDHKWRLAPNVSYDEAETYVAVVKPELTDSCKNGMWIGMGYTTELAEFIVLRLYLYQAWSWIPLPTRNEEAKPKTWLYPVLRSYLEKFWNQLSVQNFWRKLNVSRTLGTKGLTATKHKLLTRQKKLGLPRDDTCWRPAAICCLVANWFTLNCLLVLLWERVLDDSNLRSAFLAHKHQQQQAFSITHAHVVTKGKKAAGSHWTVFCSDLQIPLSSFLSLFLALSSSAGCDQPTSKLQKHPTQHLYHPPKPPSSTHLALRRRHQLAVISGAKAIPLSSPRHPPLFCWANS